MELHVPDYVIVEINGTDRTEYVISYERNDSLCELGSSFTIHFAPTYPVAILPYQTVYIEEFYNSVQANVLDGYIIGIERDFKDSDIVVSGQDKTLLLTDYFIPNQILANNENIDYWIEYYCNLVGLDVQFEASAPQIIIEEGTPMGLQNVSDAIMSLERKAAYYIKYDSSINKIRVFRLGSSDPVISLTTENSLGATRETGTEDTRNVVKVYGGYKFNPVDGSATQIFAKASTTMPELLVDKTVVVASPVLRSFTSAYMVANRILSVVNSIDDEQRITVDGFYPSIQVGDGAYINIVHANYDFRGNRQITSIAASVGPDGARTVIGVGAKCPRVSIQLPVPPIFATTTTDGVAVSWDAGENFNPSNIGLNGSDALNAWSIAVNQWGQSMVLTVAGIYKRYGTAGTWTPVGQLPNPANDEGASPAPTISGVVLTKIVEEPTRYGTFHALANISGVFTPARSWLYTTKDFGATWDSTQLYMNIIAEQSWRVTGVDIETSPANNLYALVNGIPYADRAYVLYNLTHEGRTYLWERATPTVVTSVCSQYLNDPFEHGRLITQLFAPRFHKEVCFMITTQSNIRSYTGAGAPKVIISRTVDGGESWEELYNGYIGFTLPRDPINNTVGVCIYPSNTIVFDYYGTPGDGSGHIKWCVPVVCRSSNYPDTPAAYYAWVYATGMDITINAAGDVEYTTIPPIEIASFTYGYSRYLPGVQTWKSGANRIEDKYSNEVEAGITIYDTTDGHVIDGPFYHTIELFTDTEGDDPGEGAITQTYPPLFTPYVTPSGIHGWDDGMTYYYLATSGYKMWLTSGQINIGDIDLEAEWGGVNTGFGIADDLEALVQ